MVDDSMMSASQLRQRYGRGGSAKDSELSAAQLRARYDIDNSKFDKGTRKGQGSDTTTAILVVGILILGILAGALLLSKRS